MYNIETLRNERVSITEHQSAIRLKTVHTHSLKFFTFYLFRLYTFFCLIYWKQKRPRSTRTLALIYKITNYDYYLGTETWNFPFSLYLYFLISSFFHSLSLFQFFPSFLKLITGILKIIKNNTKRIINRK